MFTCTCITIRVGSCSHHTLLTAGASAQDVAGEPESEPYGGGVLPETQTGRHGGKTGPRRREAAQSRGTV